MNTNLRLSIAQRSRINRLGTTIYADRWVQEAPSVISKISKGACKTVGELSPHLADVVMRELEGKKKTPDA